MINLNINGKAQKVEVAADTPLLWVIREHLQMTGTKFGCGAGLCGACTIHINGEPAHNLA
jgi:isoquinoline 1-oxidoreductase alpha subunit